MPMLDMTPDSDYLLVGKGQGFFNRFDANGVGTGLRHLGNIDSIEIGNEDDVITKNSSMSAEAPLYKKVTRRRDVTFTMVFSEFSPHNIALALMGEVDQTVTQAATPVVDESLTTSAVKGAHYVLAKLGPYSAVTLENATTSTALTEYVEATGLGDFRWVDRNIGIIQIVATSAAVTDGDDITASYTPTAYTAGSLHVINGASAGNIEGSFLFVGDPTAGPKMKVEVWKMSMTPDGAIGLISDEFADFTMNGSVLADPVGHPTHKLFKVTVID